MSPFFEPVFSGSLLRSISGEVQSSAREAVSCSRVICACRDLIVVIKFVFKRCFTSLSPLIVPYSIVGDLDHEPSIDDTVGRLQVTMVVKQTAMQKEHSLDNISEHAVLESPVWII